MKKCAVINDLSGFGKCSLGISLPIISAMGCEVHPLPTSVLSSQTAFGDYCCHPLSDFMKKTVLQWEKSSYRFDGILTGFVCDDEQIEIVDGFINRFKTDDTILVVDPIMADDNELYDGYTSSMCGKLRDICIKSDIITPNVFELSILAGEEHKEDIKNIDYCAKKLMNEGVKNIIVTGVAENEGVISNYVYGSEGKKIISVKDRGGYFSGTGDILASVLFASVLRGMSLESAVTLAADYIEKSILLTENKDHRQGIDFEKTLGYLIEKTDGFCSEL